ncbi:acyltransferase [Pseudoalteromonas sp. SR45-4]|uniref:acyltransferase n=1 Tax=Pseudoalteromonas sp. SR45-4 TaxID=2760929 RepID=UPI0015FA5B7B|nr:acyltransferase [Pseudoalteromonas sp. SR45-4]MBB1372608.1 acyltransferase [Pseudoalteromonas sp. SR45-4]
MLKNTITFIIRKYKNPHFEFDPNVGLLAILSLVNNRLKYKFRGMLLIFKFKKTNNLFLGKGVSFSGLNKISFGSFVTLGNYTFCSSLGESGIEFGDRVSIGDFSRVIVSTSFNNIGAGINIGNDVAIGEFSYIGGAGGVSIGSSCIIGQYFSVHSENHIFSNLHIEIREQGVTRRGILIGENCWVGSKVTVLDGSKVGNGCVIAAGAVVSGVFPDNVVIGGVPAKILKYRS